MLPFGGTTETPVSCDNCQKTFPMRTETIPRKRVIVQWESYCFVVVVDAVPILRCVVRRDAMQYAVLIRRAMGRGFDRSLHGTGGVN